MKTVLTPQQMKAVETTAIQHIGIPSLALMERAAAAVVDALSARGRLGGAPSVLVVCGTGNNGADGLAVARMLHAKGMAASYMIVGDPARATAEWNCQKKICENLQVPQAAALFDADILVDALFGIGLSRDLTGTAAQTVREMNAMRAYKVTVDVPSGVSSRTGAVMGEAFAADLTVTFQYVKTGQLLYPGRTLCGELLCADIGIPPVGLPQNAARIPQKEDLLPFVTRPQDSNKGTFGRVLVIAGSVNMCGAAFLSALAAYRSGAGLVEIFTPSENRVPLQQRIPEAVLTCYDTENLRAAKLSEALSRADAVVLGPGLSTAAYAAELVLMTLAEVRVPLIIDADALNILAANREWFTKIPPCAIITPHVKEMSRLTGQTVAAIKADPVACAQAFARDHAVTVVLKDAATVTADPDGAVCINTSGCSAMATGGSGDVLTGILGARCAASCGTTFENAAAGVYLHGLAGEEAAKSIGETAVMAGDIADGIGRVLCRI